jgi:hypothetical protein
VNWSKNPWADVSITHSGKGLGTKKIGLSEFDPFTVRTCNSIQMFDTYSIIKAGKNKLIPHKKDKIISINLQLHINQ